MKKRLLCGLLALVLVLGMVPFGTLAEENTETTAPAETTETTAPADAEKTVKSTDPTSATEETKATDPTEDTKSMDPTEETKVTDPTEETKVTDPTEETKATDPTEETKATDPTEGTETTEVTETTEPAAPTPVEQVQSLIDALPENVTAENREAVEAQLTAIDEAKLPLTDEELARLDFARYNAAIAAINELDGMAGAEVPETLTNIPTKDAVIKGLWVQGNFSTSMAETYAGSGILMATGTVNSESDLQYWFKYTGYVDCGWGDDGSGSLAFEVPDNFSFSADLGGKQVIILVNTNNYNEADGSGMTHTVLELPNGEFKITLNPNGGTFSSWKSGILVTTSKTLPALPTPTRAGYVFLGWYSTNSIVKYSEGDDVTDYLTLNAKWADPNNVKNEAELLACIADANVNTIKLACDIDLTQGLTLSSKTLTLDLNGEILGGSDYNLQLENGTSLTLMDSGNGGDVYFDKIKLATNAVLNVDGGELHVSASIQNLGTINLNGGKSLATTFDNAGTIHFNGTSLDSGYTLEDDLASESGKCLVNFMKAGTNNIGHQPVLSIAVTRGDKITTAPVAPVGENQVFLGWEYYEMSSYTQADGFWNFEDGVQSSMELYTHYCQKKTTITYEKGDEHPDATGTIPAAGIREYGKAYPLPTATFQKTGYVQIGWMDKKDAEVLYSLGMELDAEWEFYDDLTLVPVWEKVVTYQIPFTKTVQQKGDIKPGKATFSLKCIGELPDILPGVKTISDWSGEVTTKGTGTFKGTLTISGPESCLNEQLAQGIYVQEVDSKQPYWRYDTTIYCIRCDVTESEETEDGITITYGDPYCYLVKNTEDDHEPTEKEKLTKMSFTNNYTESTNPKTGDHIPFAAITTLLLTTTALTAMVPRKKRR